MLDVVLGTRSSLNFFLYSLAAQLSFFTPGPAYAQFPE
jgi:hypothetical protein